MQDNSETFQGYRYKVSTSHLGRFSEILISTVVVDDYRTLDVIDGRMINGQSHDDVRGEADLVLVAIDRRRLGNEHEQHP